jgi:Cu(I)/Ag(I) efflux system membrane protein CusA/SilA
MINRIIDFSAHNKLIIFLIVAAAAITGWWSMKHLPLDAIPDLSETQVIIYSRWDRSPDIVEDQVTYPIVTAMLGAPGVRTVRGFSDFGYSFVYVIFEEGTDIYWARARTQEYLSTALQRLPQGVQTEVCAGGFFGKAEPGGSPLLPGLDPALLSEGGAWRG